MARKTVTFLEVVSVVAEFPDEPARRLEPSELYFDSFAEAAVAIERALGLGCTVIVERERVEKFDYDEDPSLDDWPAEKYIRGPDAQGGP